MTSAWEPVKSIEETTLDPFPREVPVVPVAQEVTSNHGPVHRDDVRNMLASALASDDVISRNLVIAHVIANLDASNVDAALHMFEEAPRDWGNDQYFRLFMHAWGKIDGQAATEYAFFNPDGRKVSWGGVSAMAAWAEQDPDSARLYIEGVHADHPREGQQMSHGLIRGWAKSDLAGASKYSQGLDASKSLRLDAVDVLTEEHIKQQGPQAALDWALDVAATSDDDWFIQNVFDKTTLKAAADDGQNLADFIDRNADLSYITPQAFEEAADEWAESDPQAAAAWLESYFGDDRVTPDVVAEFADEWGKTDPRNAATWIEKHMNSGLINPKVVGRMSGEWAVNDPAGAVEWVSQLGDVKMQAEAFGYVTRQWPRDQLAGARKWIDDTPQVPQYDAARESMAYRLRGENPRDAMQLSTEITDSKRRERSLIESARAMYRENAEAVRAWLPVSGLGERAQQEVLRPSRGRR